MSQQARPTRLVSEVRLGVAVKAMVSAETVDGVVRAKDRAKDAGLTPRDLEKLKASFETHVARVRAAQLKEMEREQR